MICCRCSSSYIKFSVSFFSSSFSLARFDYLTCFALLLSLHTRARLTVISVIVATGLVALVDDCIRRRWHSERRAPWSLPARSLTKGLEFMGPRRLIGEVLQRRGSA